MRLGNRSTYEGWIQEGYQVLKGERAKEYAVLADGSHVALFSVTQTVDLELPDLLDAEIITAEEHVAQREAAKKTLPKLKMKLRETKNGRIQQLVWVGRNLELIALMKKSKFSYAGGEHRWSRVQTRDETSKTIEALAERKSFELELEHSDLELASMGLAKLK